VPEVRANDEKYSISVFAILVMFLVVWNLEVAFELLLELYQVYLRAYSPYFTVSDLRLPNLEARSPNLYPPATEWPFYIHTTYRV
jgi:hypothetical protein